MTVAAGRVSARVDKPRKEEAAGGLVGTYGESAGLLLIRLDFRGCRRGKRGGSKARDNAIWGLLATCAGGFSVFRGVLRKPTVSRNAVQIGVSIEQFGGHLIMRPVPLVVHGFWAAGHV